MGGDAEGHVKDENTKGGAISFTSAALTHPWGGFPGVISEMLILYDQF